MLFEFSLKTSQTDREDGELNRVGVEEELKLFDSLSCLSSTVRDFVVTRVGASLGSGSHKYSRALSI